MSAESKVWNAVLDALRDECCVATDQVDVEGVDPKTRKRILYEMAETGWVDRVESRDEWHRGVRYVEVTPACEGTRRHAWDRRDEGDAHRADHEYVRAGEQYTAAARAYLGEGPPAPMTYARRAVVMLLQAAICFRLGDAPRRGDRRCREGTHVTLDAIEHAELEYDAEELSRATWFGAWHEYLGDLRLHGNVGDPNGAYDRAETIYERAQPTSTLLVEAENRSAVGHFNRLVEAVDADVEAWESDPADESRFTDWLAYKREHLPRLLDALYEAGEWS